MIWEVEEVKIWDCYDVKQSNLTLRLETLKRWSRLFWSAMAREDGLKVAVE